MNRMLADIRRALQVRGDEAGRRARVQARLAQPPRNLIPQRAVLAKEELVAAFRRRLEEAEASTNHVEGVSNVADEVARYLASENLPPEIRCGSDEVLAQIPWAEQTGLDVRHGAARERDAVSLTRAFAGAAETGTLFVASGPANPVTLSFLPETNIVLVRALDIVGSYEEAFERLPRHDGNLPRTLNMISGPSRTADIEQTLITGAHGPRRLHVIVAG